MIDEEFVNKDGRYWYPKVLRKVAIDSYYENYLAQQDLQECYRSMEEVENDGSVEESKETVEA